MVTGRYGVPLLGLAKSIYFFLADSQKKKGCLLCVEVCLLFSTSRSLSSRRKYELSSRLSHRVTVSTSLDCGKKKYREWVKINQIVFRVEKDFFTTTREMGKHCELNRTASVFNFFRGDKKLVSFRKTKLVNEYYKTHCFLIEKFVVVGKTG